MFSLSLKTKMSIIVSLLIAFLLCVVAFFTLAYFENQLKGSISSQQLAMASSVAEQIDDKIRTYQNELVQVARTISPELLAHKDKARKFIENRFDTVSMFDSGLFLYSPHRGLIAGTGLARAGIEKGCPYLGEIEKTIQSKTPRISDPFFCPEAQGHPIVMFTAPILDARGEVVALLAGNLDLMKDNFLGRLASAKIGESGYFYIFNEHRMLLLHKDRSRILTPLPNGVNRALEKAVNGFEGTEETVTSRGLPVLSTFIRLKATNWILSTNYPLSEAYAPIQRAKQTMLTALLALMAMSILVVWVAMRHLMAPLVLFTSRIRSISGNEETPASVQIHTKDEIEDLATAFNRMMADIGSHKKALQEEKEFEKSLVQHSSLPTFVIDANHRVLHWNKACEGLTGIPASDVVGTDGHWRAFYASKHPMLADVVIDHTFEEAASFYPVFEKRADGLHAEGWYPNLNGKERYISFYAAPIYNGTDLVAAIEIIEDVTEQNLAGKQTQQALSLLSATLESTADGILVRDLARNVITCNGKLAEMWRIPPSVLATKDDKQMRLFVLDQLKDPDKFLEITEKLYDQPEMETNDILEFKDGRVFERVSKPQIIENEIVGTVISFRDITERSKAEEALRESAERYRSLVNNIDLGITLIDNNHRIIMANDAMGRMLNKASNELLNKECFREYEKRPAQCPHCPGAVAMETGKPATVQTEGIRDDGSSFVVKIRAFPVFDSDGNATRFIEVVQDITEQVQAENDKSHLEEQLRQSQKFEAIGTLAGGIAHDFNNFLTVITAYCSLMERKTAEDDPLRNYLGKIFSATEKATSLTRSLLAYSRKQAIDPRPVDLSEIIQKVHNLLARLLGEDIELTMRFAPEQLTIMADSLQIEQVLMNLATNARDAMPQGGILQIATERVEMDAEFVKAHGYGAPGGYAVLIVSDTGRGIREEIKEKIFEPFFTTKAIGKGTGLGLSMVYGIVKQHNGYINVYSEPDKGSTFRIYLPLTDSARTEIGRTDVPRPKGGNETILLVEDDPEIRSSLKELLEQDGYAIIEAVDGEDGIRKFADHRDDVHLLLLDVIMPKKNGKEVYEEIRTMRPGIKAIFVSGYTADILSAKGILQGDVNLISKPIAINMLSAKIREVLKK